MATAKKSKRVIEAEGVAHISATFNNTTITITDTHGNAVSWGSSGKAGFKGSKKSTPFAATVAAEQAAREAMSLGVRRVHVRVQGPGSGRESAIQALAAAGLQVKSIKDDSAQRLPSSEAAEGLSDVPLYRPELPSVPP
jgi:small subunit ribosomal protein S11